MNWKGYGRKKLFLNFIYVGRPKCFRNSGIIFGKKRVCKKANLVTLEVLPFCTCALVPVVLPLLEAPLEVPFWPGSETSCSVLLRFLCRRKTTSFEPHIECKEKPGVALSEIRRLWWLGDG
jgi:hypothetical protein